jgi:hypothetical protein
MLEPVLRTCYLGPAACRRRFIMPSLLLFFASIAFATDARASSCELTKKSIVSRSSSGLAQVSNLGGIRITCHVPARAFPTKPGGTRYGLRVAITAYEFSADGSKKSVPSEVHMIGDGFGPETEWVDFYILIPLYAKELDAEARRYLAKVEESMTPEQKAQIKADPHEQAFENLRKLVYQNRLGHFQLDCRVMDASRETGMDKVEFEVQFSGRFSDVGLPGSTVAFLSFRSIRIPGI